MSKNNRIRSSETPKVSIPSKVTRVSLDTQYQDGEDHLKPIPDDTLVETEIQVGDAIDIQPQVSNEIESQNHLFPSDSELVYASVAKCLCGAGLAHVQNAPESGSWYCSDLLTGRAKMNPNGYGHLAGLPFRHYSVMSELHPRSFATTRPNRD